MSWFPHLSRSPGQNTVALFASQLKDAGINLEAVTENGFCMLNDMHGHMYRIAVTNYSNGEYLHAVESRFVLRPAVPDAIRQSIKRVNRDVDRITFSVAPRDGGEMVYVGVLISHREFSVQQFVKVSLALGEYMAQLDDVIDEL